MTPGELTVDVVSDDGRATVLLHGELDANTEAAAHDAMTRAADGASEVVLDLRGLDFVDSSGLKLAVVWTRRLREDGVALTILRGGPQVQRPFASAGLDALLPFADGPAA